MKFAVAAPFVTSLNAVLARETEISAPASTLQGRNILDIFLHGMFAVHFVDDNINDIHQVILYPPHVEGDSPHSYFASDLTGSPAHFLKLDYGGTYPFFTNVIGADTMPTNYSEVENVVVPMSPDAPEGVTRDSTKVAHCKIILPMPHAIVPRRLQFSKFSKPLFSHCVALKGGACPDRVPLVTVLRYDQGFNGTGQDNVSKYHFFAEPESCPKDIHSSEALDALRQLYNHLPKERFDFNLCLGLNDLGSIPEAPGGEITSDDELSLLELLHPGLQCQDTPAPAGCSPKALVPVDPKIQLKVPSKPKPPATKPHATVPQKTPDTPPPSGMLGIHPTACMSVLFVPS